MLTVGHVVSIALAASGSPQQVALEHDLTEQCRRTYDHCKDDVAPSVTCNIVNTPHTTSVLSDTQHTTSVLSDTQHSETGHYMSLVS